VCDGQEFLIDANNPDVSLEPADLGGSPLQGAENEYVEMSPTDSLTLTINGQDVVVRR
jgi:hypothetical protein